MSDMETTTEQRAGLMHTLSILENTPDDSRDAEVMRKLCRDLDRAFARIAELEAEVDAEKRWRKVCLDGSAKRLAELEALFRLDGEQHAAAVNAARHEQDKRVEVYADRITKLEAELKMARLVFGKAVIRHTNKDPDDLWDALMWEIKDARPAS